MESLFNYIFQDIKYRQQCDSVTTKHMFINYIANYSVNLLPCFSGVFFAGDGIYCDGQSYPYKTKCYKTELFW